VRLHFEKVPLHVALTTQTVCLTKVNEPFADKFRARRLTARTFVLNEEKFRPAKTKTIRSFLSAFALAHSSGEVQ